MFWEIIRIVFAKTILMISQNISFPGEVETLHAFISRKINYLDSWQGDILHLITDLRQITILSNSKTFKYSNDMDLSRYYNYDIKMIILPAPCQMRVNEKRGTEKKESVKFEFNTCLMHENSVG